MDKEFYNILVCDVNVKKQGHYLSFDQYILDKFQTIETSDPQLKIFFLFNQRAEELLPADAGIRERIFFMDDPETDTMFKRYRIVKQIKNIAEKKRIDHLLFMDLDQYQIPFFMARFSIEVSGILFRPHHRITTSENDLASGSKKLKRLKKIFSERLMTAGNILKNIFILNDEEGVEILNKVHQCSTFKYLPDPVFSFSSVSKKDKISIQQKPVFRYLIFGSINERKNIVNVIRAYKLASLHFDSELVIAGPANEKYLQLLQQEISEAGLQNSSQKKVIIKSGFVSDVQMDELFCQSQVCLLIYKNFFGSSGVLGRAALHKLKVIGPNVGLLYQLISKYQMGITADPGSVKEIAEALLLINEFSLNENVCHKYYVQNSPEKFIRILFDTICNEGISVAQPV